MTAPKKATAKQAAAGFDDRVSNDKGAVTVAAGDITTSDEAMKVLREHGVEAWEKWCAEHAATRSEETAVTASLADPPVEDGLEPGEGGDPAEPQPCQYGDEPAIESILFRDGDAYVPTCADHDDEARQALADAGETVSEVVKIGDSPAVTAAAPVVEAPETVEEPDAGEWAVRFPVMAVEDLDTSDGRYLTPGQIMARACPLTILAQPFSSHGGAEPPYAVTVGRLDRMERVPGPSLASRATGEPFPEGTFVWIGHGHVDPTIDVHGLNIGNLLKRRFLNGASVDLAGMDAEIVGEGGMAVDPENPRRQMVAHSAEIGAVTLCPIPAFGDAYVELVDQVDPLVASGAVAPDELPEGFSREPFPMWRSAEVGDYPALVAAADTWPAGVPSDAVDQLTSVIEDDGGEQRDAPALAQAIVDYIAAQWASGDTDTAMPDDAPAEDEGAMAATDTPVEDPMPDDLPTETGMPDEPQQCAIDPADPAVMSLLFADGEQYVPCCQAHEQDARDAIKSEGGEVSGVVPIGPVDEQAKEETP